jgi:hypothetical protein
MSKEKIEIHIPEELKPKTKVLGYISQNGKYYKTRSMAKLQDGNHARKIKSKNERSKKYANTTLIEAAKVTESKYRLAKLTRKKGYGKTLADIAKISKLK